MVYLGVPGVWFCPSFANERPRGPSLYLCSHVPCNNVSIFGQGQATYTVFPNKIRTELKIPMA